MMLIKNNLFFIFLICIKFTSSQTIQGHVYDAETNNALETVSVYFNNTSIGTSTDKNGYFEIENKINSQLIISHLGYDRVIIPNSKITPILTIKLLKSTNNLKEVVIHRNDPFTREQKLMMFKRGFLGDNKYAKYCEIKNEDDLVLRYHKDINGGELIVHSKRPLIINNNYLGYTLFYDLIEYTATLNGFHKKTVYYGVSLFNNKKKIRKKHLKNRKKTYNGSIQHFIKSLYNNELKKNNFNVIENGMIVKNHDYIKINKYKTDAEILFTKDTVRLIHSIKKTHHQSIIFLETDTLLIDKNLSYDPRLIIFGGHLGREKISLMLPLDFKIE